MSRNSWNENLWREEEKPPLSERYGIEPDLNVTGSGKDEKGDYLIAHKVEYFLDGENTVTPKIIRPSRS